MNEEKTKILFLITKGNFGGAQRYVFDLASNLPNDKFEVVVAFGDGDLLEEKLREKNVRTIRLENAQRDISILKDIKLFFELFRLYKKERPNIVHLNSSKIGIIGSLVARTYQLFCPRLSASYPRPVRIVFTAHGWAFNEKRPTWQKKIIKIIQWLTVIMSYKTIAVSENAKKDFAGWPLTDKRIDVIYNGIERQKILSREEAREKLLPQKSDSFWIGTVSELHKNKGLDVLIKAVSPIIKENPPVILTIIGIGEEKTNLQSLIKKEKLEDSVFLLGFVENAGSYLKAFDIFTLSSRTEGLPYVLLEAGMAGIPTVASRVGGIPEIINENCGILTERENIEELRAKLQFLLENREQREKLGENLKKISENNFTLDKMVKKTILIYNNR